MAASSSTVAHSNNNQWYDVFINHRGPDVKKTFARSLYLRLLSYGLRAFLDQEELQHGYNFPSQIKHAIRSASVHVAIFSPGYAESEWCLHELLLMLESNAPIIPVFYRMRPSEVRWTQTGSGNYARALQKLAKRKTYDPQTHKKKWRYDSNTIEQWRNALSSVADNIGFELEVCNGDELELELLDKLVERLSKMVKKPDLHVAKYPIGLDEKLKHFEDKVLLQHQLSRKPQILGIVGTGGVGKTTLAKEFFNRKNSKYFRSCFLHEIRDNAAKGSLNSLQRELLKSLTSKDVPIDSVEEGKRMIIKHLKSSKALGILGDVDYVSNVLVVLDDVDNVNQVEALLPVDLGSGSLVLITTRDKHVLIGSKVENSSIYMLYGLTNQQSRDLFCSHAFSQTDPLPGFESLVDRFLEACNGLPLSLKVFGANLYGRDRSYWEDELGSFPTEIKERLKISYDALSLEEKQIFLDLACFFIGQNRDTAISLWDKSGWKGRRGFQILQDKCLVEVDRRNVIIMHEHLIDLGKNIAEESSPRRLWRWTENVIDGFLEQSSVIPVRGIKMDLTEYTDDCDHVLGGIGMRRLRILHTEGSLLERILKSANMELLNILWLSWINCPYSSLPSWIPMKNLRVLEVSGSILNTLWQREGEWQATLPVSLEVLKANNCVKLKSIRGLELLTKLRHLSVIGCSELEELQGLEALVSLEEFDASGCVKLKSIQELEHCSKLRRLIVYGCSRLEELPSMKALVSLEDFDAFECVKLKREQWYIWRSLKH